MRRPLAARAGDELDWPDVTTIDRQRVPDIRKLGDSLPQRSEAQGAALYLDPSG